MLKEQEMRIIGKSGGKIILESSELDVARVLGFNSVQDMTKSGINLSIGSTVHVSGLWTRVTALERVPPVLGESRKKLQQAVRLLGEAANSIIDIREKG